MAAPLQLRGARALVTGATGGIGAAIARSLRAQGAELVLTGRKVEVLEELATELGGEVIVADLSDRTEVDRLIAEAGEIDVLVANAALPASGALLEYTPEQIQRSIFVNLEAPILLARAAGLQMQPRGRGHIVMIGSVAGVTASGLTSLYNATKFGLRGFSLAFRQDLKPAGVGVSIVEPGFVRDAGMFVEAGGELPKGVRTVSPEEVSAAVLRAISRDKAEIVVAPPELRLGATVGSLFPELSAKVQRRGGGEKITHTLVEGQRAKR